MQVPITKEVLEWAIDESGLDAAAIAEAAGVPEERLAAWVSGDALPTVTQLKAVAGTLHRQFATFLLPSPPLVAASNVRFRHPLKRRSRALNFEERRFIRRARRLQDAHAWLSRELNRAKPDLPMHSLAIDATMTAAELRRRLEVSLQQQFDWKSPSHAFDGWRAAVENLGVIVVQFPMGEDSCRGFSLWDEHAPLIAVNTAWADEARIFSLFHEVAHLLLRSDSACAQPDAGSAGTEPTERWCEAFAAAVIVPGESLDHDGRISDLGELTRLARKYRVSVRAMAIRLINLGKATWGLYRRIPKASDRKRMGGRGAARGLREIREDELGWRGLEIFLDATRREVITESQALDFLDISPADFDLLATDAHLR